MSAPEVERSVSLVALEARQAAMRDLTESQAWFLMVSLLNGLTHEIAELDRDGALERHAKALAYSVQSEAASRPAERKS